MGGWWWWLGTVVIGRRGGREMWWLGSVVVGDRGLERRAVRRGGCKTQKLRFSLACSVEALFTRSECHHELAPMRAHSYVMDGGELQVERATGKTQQQLDRVWVVPSDSPRARSRAKSRLLCSTRVRFRLLQLCVCDLGVG